LLFEERHVDLTDSSDVEFLGSDRTRTPAWLIGLACAAHAGAASLAERRDLCEWFGVDRRRATIQHWYQTHAAYYEQDFTVEPERVAVDEKQIQLEIERFHETWNGSQTSAERWLTAYTAHYNHQRSHQALDDQPPVEALNQEGSI